VRTKGHHPKVHLVSQADLDAAWMEYRAEIWAPRPSTALEFQADDSMDAFADRPLAGMNSFPLNAGVERWSSRSVDEIKEMLGIPASGLPGCARDANGDPVSEPMWHQWASVIEMIDRTFTMDGEDGRPTLLADEVGMGKTVQVIVYLQVLWHLKTMQDSNANWPSTSGGDAIMRWPPFLGKCIIHEVISKIC
jgi:SNF2 family DNA or RNA helicase